MTHPVDFPQEFPRWELIETAPRDGTLYLAVLDRKGWYAVLNQPPGCARGQWMFVDGEWIGESDEFQPTHWMPLPAAPSSPT